MRKIIFVIFALVACLAVNAKQYCESAIAANGHTAYITCRSLGGDQYEFIFTSEDDFSGYNAAGSNLYANINGVGGYHVSEHFVQSGRTLTCTMTSNQAPTFYVGDFFVNYANGEAHFYIPTDADFSATCEGTPSTNPQDTTSVTPQDSTHITPQDTVAAQVICGIDWSKLEWLGNGSGNEANTNKYKISLDEGQQVANVQAAPWDNNNAGIYTWVESGVTSVSVPAGIDGAGVLLRLTSFTAQVTRVDIVAATKNYTCYVYYADGTPVTDCDQQEPTPNTAVDALQSDSTARKVLRSGHLLILRSGHLYDTQGHLLE